YADKNSGTNGEIQEIACQGAIREERGVRTELQGDALAHGHLALPAQPLVGLRPPTGFDLMQQAVHHAQHFLHVAAVLQKGGRLRIECARQDHPVRFLLAAKGSSADILDAPQANLLAGVAPTLAFASSYR